jgi:hypothetical protein
MTTPPHRRDDVRTIRQRVLAIPPLRRRLLGVVGALVGLGLVVAGLASLDTGSAPVTVPGSVVRGTLPPGTR